MEGVQGVLKGGASFKDWSLPYTTGVLRESLRTTPPAASVAVCCSVLQWVALRCSGLQRVLRESLRTTPPAACVTQCCSVLQCDTVCCSMLQCAAVYCSVMQ